VLFRAFFAFSAPVSIMKPAKANLQFDYPLNIILQSVTIPNLSSVYFSDFSSTYAGRFFMIILEHLSGYLYTFFL